VLIVIKDPKEYKPLSVQFTLLGILKSMYPKQFEKKLSAMNASKKRLFCLASGSDKALTILEKERFATWKLLELDKTAREEFLKKRQKYLRAEYQE